MLEKFLDIHWISKVSDNINIYVDIIKARIDVLAFMLSFQIQIHQKFVNFLDDVDIVNLIQ